MLFLSTQIYGTDRVVVRVARPTKRTSGSFSPFSGGVNIEEPSRNPSGFTADEMRRRLEAIELPAADAAGNQPGVAFSATLGETGGAKLGLSAAEGQPHLHVYKLSENLSSGFGNNSAASAEITTEEDSNSETSERRQAIIREMEEQSRLSHEERAARQRARHKQHVERQQQRLQEALRLAESEGLEEDVYTLSNWTSLLPANLQQRILAAQEKMAGAVADPGVSSQPNLLSRILLLTVSRRNSLRCE